MDYIIQVINTLSFFLSPIIQVDISPENVDENVLYPFAFPLEMLFFKILTNYYLYIKVLGLIKANLLSSFVSFSNIQSRIRCKCEYNELYIFVITGIANKYFIFYDICEPSTLKCQEPSTLKYLRISLKHNFIGKAEDIFI